MNKTITIINLFFLLFLFPSIATATHIVGGEMTYNCLGNNRYEIRLTIFRDCENGVPPFDPTAYIGVFNAATGSYIRVESIPLGIQDDTLDLDLSNPCYSIPPDVCIHTTTYRKVILLPFRTGGYHLAYQRCCRNNIIDNINSPSSTGATYDVVISEAALRGCNSSARFREWPPFYLCAGSPINYDNSAFDPDGDSIVYELCNPYDGANTGNPAPTIPSSPPYTSVSWAFPYGLNNMLGGSDPFRVDPITGILGGTPPSLGTFVVGICAKEYRNGILIGITKRDFQYSVGICNKLVNANFIVPNSNCRNNLNIITLNASAPSNNSYVWNFGDNSPWVTGSNPSHSYQDTGTYTVTLVAGAGQPCDDTIRQQVSVQLDGTDILVSPLQYICPGVTDTVLFVANNNLANYNNIVGYNWTSNGTIISGQGTDSLLLLANGTNVTLNVVAVNDNGCVDQEFTGLEVDFVEAAFDTLSFDCNRSLAIPFENQSTTSLNTFFWDFDGTGSSTAVFPTHTFPDTGTYTVSLIAGYGGICQDTIAKDVYVSLEGVALLNTFPVDACSGDTLDLAATASTAGYNTIVSYNWTTSKPLLSGQGTDQVRIVADTAISYSISVINDNGCTDTIEGNIDVFISDALFDSINLECNADLEIDFTNQSTITGGTYFWNLGGISSSVDENPSYTFPDTGLYNIVLVAGVGTACQDTFDRWIDLKISKAEILASDSQIVCRGDTVMLTAANLLSNYNQIVSYNWSPAANIIAGQGTDTVLALANADIDFEVVGVNDEGCADTAYAEVNVTAISPAMAIYAVPDSIFVGQSSQIYATNFLEYIYNWTPDTTLSDWYIAEPVAKPRQTKTYYLTVANQFNCVHKDSVTIYIKPPECIDPLVFVPNAFTPDGDGYNDVLMVEGVDINFMTMKIYNRWGQLVFETNDKSIGWDGTYKGKQLPPDVYGYYMQCSCDQGGQLRLKGNITLLR